jgi:hypothetical protein
VWSCFLEDADLFKHPATSITPIAQGIVRVRENTLAPLSPPPLSFTFRYPLWLPCPSRQAMLSDPCEYVRFVAAANLRHLLGLQAGLDLLRPVVRDVLGGLFKLMDAMGMDEVTETIRVRGRERGG